MKHVTSAILIASLITATVYAECDLSIMAHSLPYLGSAETNCTTNADCTSVKCSGHHEGKAFIAGMVLSLCDAEPSISIIAHVPHLGIKDWNAVFRNSTKLRIPGFRPLSSSSGAIISSVFVEVGITRFSGAEYTLDVTLKGCVDDNHCPMVNTTLQNRTISTHCANNRNPQQWVRECDISVPFVCNEKETCQQIDSGTRGVCVPLNETEAEPTDLPPPTTDASTDKNDQHMAVNIAVPLLFVVLVGSLIFAAYRNGWIRRLRRSMGQPNRFEQLPSGTRVNDDDDEPLPL